MLTGISQARAARPRRYLAALVTCCFWGLLAAAAVGHASGARSLAGSEQWGRLVALWHTMLDHSSETIYSRVRFQELVKDMDVMDSDLSELAKLGLLREGVAADLRRLFHARYEYILTRHYTTESHLRTTEEEAAAATARWVIELQLAGLRAVPAGGKESRGMIAGAESSIAYELSFLYQYDKLEASMSKRRQELEAKKAPGQELDMQPFENDCIRRRLLLLDAYGAHRIRVAAPVKALMPYVVSLTRARPSPPLAAAPSPDSLP
jgi:hypothetical protein